jgi:hypothetical protein
MNYHRRLIKNEYVYETQSLTEDLPVPVEPTILKYTIGLAGDMAATRTQFGSPDHDIRALLWYDGYLFLDLENDNVVLSLESDGVVVQELIHDPASGSEGVIMTKKPTACSNKWLEELSLGLHQLFFPPSHRLPVFVWNVIPPSSHNDDVLQGIFTTKHFEDVQVAI